jgi:transposase
VRPPAAFDITPAGLRRLVAFLPEPAATRVVFESTGVYAKRLIQALDGVVASLHQLNPRIIKRRASSAIQTKTDHADARLIAKVGHDLALTDPAVLEHASVRFDPAFEDLSLWTREFHRLGKLQATLKTQIEDLEHHTAPAAKILLRRLRRELTQLQKRRDEVAAIMDQAADAAVLVARIGDIRRFDSADALKGYFGLYPRRVQSGRREGRTRMARHGCKLVRHMLWNCAKSAARFNPVCVALYERLKSKGATAPACYGAVARKLLHLVYGVLKHRTPFRKELAIT